MKLEAQAKMLVLDDEAPEEDHDSEGEDNYDDPDASAQRVDPTEKNYRVRGLMYCEKCKQYKNRDTNACENMYRAVQAKLRGHGPPEHLKQWIHSGNPASKLIDRNPDSENPTQANTTTDPTQSQNQRIGHSQYFHLGDKESDFSEDDARETLAQQLGISTDKLIPVRSKYKQTYDNTHRPGKSQDDKVAIEQAKKADDAKVERVREQHGDRAARRMRGIIDARNKAEKEEKRRWDYVVGTFVRSDQPEYIPTLHKVIASFKKKQKITGKSNIRMLNDANHSMRINTLGHQ